MSVCPEHGVEKVLRGGELRCPTHRLAAQARYEATDKGRATLARFRATDKGRAVRSRENTRRWIRNLGEGIERKEALIRELATQAGLSPEPYLEAPHG